MQVDKEGNIRLLPKQVGNLSKEQWYDIMNCNQEESLMILLNILLSYLVQKISSRNAQRSYGY
ncbi:MAG: hypothetical protein RCG15_03880 [Candidatus Rickettsia vulgarisii]